MRSLAKSQAPSPGEPFPSHDLGPLEARRLIAGTGAIEERLLRTTHLRERSCGFLLIVSGAARCHHYGHDVLLQAGDFLMFNAAAPISLQFESLGECIVLRVSPRDLRSYLPAPEQFFGRPLRANDGISEAAADLVQSIFEQFEAGFTTEFRSRIARTLLDTLATAFSIVLDGELSGSPVICSRNARVRLHIEHNLRNPDLKPASIAADLRMSSRYLRVIFAASNETVSAYILRRRLEECARELADPKLNHLSITEIAFGWGFNSGPHFTRSFRLRFEISPREYRRRNQLSVSLAAFRAGRA